MSKKVFALVSGIVGGLQTVGPENTPKEKLREYVMKENMHYAENDRAMLSTWNLKELADWRVPMSVKMKKQKETPEVEFTQILDESHNYVVLYFDNEVDWLQAQTLFDIKPVRLLSTKRNSDNINGRKVGVGRVLRGADIINRLLMGNGLGSKTRKNKG